MIVHPSISFTFIFVSSAFPQRPKDQTTNFSSPATITRLELEFVIYESHYPTSPSSYSLSYLPSRESSHKSRNLSPVFGNDRIRNGIFEDLVTVNHNLASLG